MNYYIQGNKDRAEEIKAAFEAKGFKLRSPLSKCDQSDMIYFSLNSKVGGIKLRNLDLFKTHPDYKELELPDAPKYKDGDVLVTTKIRSCPFIYRKPDFNNDLAYYYVGIDGNGNLSIGWPKKTLCHFGLIANTVIAGQGQRDLLFKKMKDAGYEWDAEKKELRKIKPHYDIANFKPFDKVLIRVGNNSKWTCDFFSYYHNGFHCVGTDDWSQCIPFEGNETLLGTTDPCSEEFVNW